MPAPIDTRAMSVLAQKFEFSEFKFLWHFFYFTRTSIERNLNLLTFQTHRKCLDGKHWGKGSDLTGANVKAPAVAGAFDLVVPQFTLAQRTPIVGAQVLRRKIGPLDVTQGDVMSIDVKSLHLAIFYITDACDGYELCH
jgi:hypothetical protein